MPAKISIFTCLKRALPDASIHLGRWLLIEGLSLKSVNRVTEIKESDMLNFIGTAQHCKDKHLNTARLFSRFLYELTKSKMVIVVVGDLDCAILRKNMSDMLAAIPAGLPSKVKKRSLRT